MSLVLSSSVLLFLSWFTWLFTAFWEIFLCMFLPEIHIVWGCRRSYFEGKPPYLALLPSMFFHGTEPSSSSPSSMLWEKERHDEKQKGRHFKTVILKLGEALLKSCGKPLAIIHILSESGIGSLQRNWHLGTSLATWICGISMLQVKSPTSANGGSQGKPVQKSCWWDCGRQEAFSGSVPMLFSQMED